MGDSEPKKKNKLFWKEVADQRYGLLSSEAYQETEWKRKKWPFFGGAIAVLGMMALADNYLIKSGTTEKIISALRGENKTAEILAPLHAGTVDFATAKYFSLAEDGLEYVISDYDASKLKQEGAMDVFGNTAADNSSIVIVDKISKPGAKKKDPALYTKVQQPDYSDASIPDKMSYQPLSNLNYTNKTSWEKQPETVRVFGRINTVEKYIEILEKDKPVGKVVVSDIKEYAFFQLQQLGEQNTFMFYLKKGDTVDWKMRQKTKELFTAQVLGLDKLEITK